MDSPNAQVASLNASCSFSFEIHVSTPMIFMLRPHSSPAQWIEAEEYKVSPAVPVSEFTDDFGNLCQRLVAPVGYIQVSASVRARVQYGQRVPASAGFVEVPDLPNDTLRYLLPSRYCESDRFGEMAANIVTHCVPGYDQVQTITDWVRGSIRNTPLSSTYPVSAVEVHQRGEGVCRDLAHICISLCRALCIPARLVVGYLSELVPMDAHAWFEAFIGGRWYTFDATCIDGDRARIAVARGRDAADVALYNQYGPVLLPSAMAVHVDTIW